jgi:hypothetical protein
VTPTSKSNSEVGPLKAKDQSDCLSEEVNRVVAVFGNDGGVWQGTPFRNATVVCFDGHQYVVSHKAILTVNVTAACNAACGFCFNGITFFPEEPSPILSETDLAPVLQLTTLAGVHKVAYS